MIKKKRMNKISKINKMNRMNKKGDLPSGFVVMVILLLIGFVILLFFLFRISLTERADKEICRQSVVFRGTASALSGVAEDFVPLKCKTAKYCITAGKGECEEFKGEEKEVTKVKVKDNEEIARFLVQETIDCWSMMGEGKIGLFSQYMADTYGLGKVYPTCVICSRIAFDLDSFKGTKIEIDKIDVLSYMITHKPPGKDVSYYRYFVGEGGEMGFADASTFFDNLGELEEDIGDVKDSEGQDEKTINQLSKALTAVKSLESPEAKETEEFETETSSQASILFMQISSPGHLDSLKNIVSVAGGAALGSFILAPRTTLKFAGGAAKAIIAHPIVAAIVVIVGISTQQGVVAWNRAVTAGYCGDVAVGTGAREGCSAVRLVDYDENAISNVCSVIESIP